MSKVALPFVLVLLLAASAAAQTTGSITGTITDDAGGLVPGVRVTATSPALMGAQVAVTNADGIYRFPSLPPGTYRLKAELPGFAIFNREEIIINIGFTATVDMKMSVATRTDEVTVTGKSPVVDT